MYNILSNILTGIIVFTYYSFKVSLLIYRFCSLLVKAIDDVVEAIMIRTIYRLSDTQKKVLMHIFILLGVGIVRELSP